MQRRVERKYFDQWAAANRPDAIRKLANKSDVAMAYIERVRAGYVPPKELYRRRFRMLSAFLRRNCFPSSSRLLALRGMQIPNAVR